MYAVEMRGITKRFPGMIANDQIEFLVEKGEIHSLLGENGAGKNYTDEDFVWALPAGRGKHQN